MKGLVQAFLGAVAFMTRLPVPGKLQGRPEDLPHATMFFPLVGLLIGAGAIGLSYLLAAFVARDAGLVVVLAYLVIVTGGFHEDALADAADGFGGGWGKDRILEIMHDSRIGSFGALAIELALLARFVFLKEIPAPRFAAYLLAGQVACRWTALPLAFLLPPAREEGGQGARLAGRIPVSSLVVGTILTAGILGTVLGMKALWVGLAAMAVTAASGAYYRSQIGGITGDCLGATNQLTEIAVYFAGVVLH